MLKKICTDLETSKRLKELGFDDSESEFVYWKGKPEYYHNLPFFEIDRIQDLITCYTLEQILNELPRNIMISQIVYDLSIDNYDIGYHNILFKKTYIQFSKQNNLATAAAKLWIKLKEDNVI